MFVEEKKQGETLALDEASKILLKAADLLEDVGICKYTRWDGTSYCVYGALAKVYADYHEANLTGEGKTALQRLERVVGTSPKGEGWGAADWHNAPERTAEEVVAML